MEGGAGEWDEPSPDEAAASGEGARIGGGVASIDVIYAETGVCFSVVLQFISFLVLSYILGENICVGRNLWCIDAA